MCRHHFRLVCPSLGYKASCLLRQIHFNYFVAERSLLALQLVVVLSFPALALAAPSGFATSLESRVQKLEDTVFSPKKKLKQWRENARTAERLADIKRMDAKEDGSKAERLADIKRMDAAGDRTFALSFASFAIASTFLEYNAVLFVYSLYSLHSPIPIPIPILALSRAKGSSHPFALRGCFDTR